MITRREKLIEGLERIGESVNKHVVLSIVGWVVILAFAFTLSLIKDEALSSAGELLFVLPIFAVAAHYGTKLCLRIVVTALRSAG